MNLEKSSLAPSADSVCAVVVTFNPNLEVLGRLFRQILRQKGLLIVVDNGSACIQDLRNLVAAAGKPVSLEELERNRGLAHGLNVGIRKAIGQGHDWVFLFDQDSELEEGFFEGLLGAARETQGLSARVAAIGPLLRDPTSRRLSEFRTFRSLLPRGNLPVTEASGLFDTDFLITSGTMLSVSAFQAVGEMRESFFIDNVDRDWCFRARAQGYVLLGTSAAVLKHRIGEDRTGWLYRKGLVAHHPPERFYYTTRNRLKLYSEAYVPKYWIVQDSIRFSLKTIILLLTSDRRKEYWSQFRRAVRDSRTLMKP